MRIVWKDSNSREKKPIKYRKYHIEGYGDGWVTNIDGDNNIYRNHYCALNAIDEHLGGSSQKGEATSKRKGYGIQIIGKINNETA